MGNSKAIFLDRDGVTNKAIILDNKPFSPKTIKEVVLGDGIRDLITFFKKKGYMIFVVTNQPDVARGNNTRKNVFEINEFLRRELGLDDIMTCFHDGNNCMCRKPKPGMLNNLALLYGIDTSKSIMIGDRESDIEAGASAGCKTIFVDYGYDENRPIKADIVVNNIGEIQNRIKEIL